MTAVDTILIVPCFNEEARIDSAAFLAFLQRHPDFRFVFVDDGSTDRTAFTLQQLATADERITIVTQPANRGKGEAVRQGMLTALQQFPCQYIGFTDADLSTPLAETLRFRHLMDDQPAINLVLGSRVQMLGRSIKRNLYRHWFSRIIATLICKVLNEPVYDTQCGAKLLRSQCAVGLVKEPFISRWLFDVELLARYKKDFSQYAFQQTIQELPVLQWEERPGSKLRYYYLFRILFDLLRIQHHYFRRP